MGLSPRRFPDSAMRKRALATLCTTVKSLSTEGSGTWSSRCTAQNSSRALTTAANNRVQNSSELNGTEANATSENSDVEVPVAIRIAGWGIAAASAGLAGVMAYVTNKYSQEEIVQKVAAMQIDNTPKPLVMIAEAYRDSRDFVERSFRYYSEPLTDKLLPDQNINYERHRIPTLVIDLDEVLVKSEWKRGRGWRVYKRPGVDDFLALMAQHYEIVVVTPESNTYADPILERLDSKGTIMWKLYKESMFYRNGEYYFDLSKLNRDLTRVVFLTSREHLAKMQPDNHLSIKPYNTGNEVDTQLLDYMPLLEAISIQRPYDVRTVLSSFKDSDDIPRTFRERHKAAMEKVKKIHESHRKAGPFSRLLHRQQQ